MIKVTGIIWETDGNDPKELGLPTEEYISEELDDPNEEIADWLSNKYGWLVSEIGNYVILE